MKILLLPIFAFLLTANSFAADCKSKENCVGAYLRMAEQVNDYSKSRDTMGYLTPSEQKTVKDLGYQRYTLEHQASKYLPEALKAKIATLEAEKIPLVEELKVVSAETEKLKEAHLKAIGIQLNADDALKTKKEEFQAGRIGRAQLAEYVAHQQETEKLANAAGDAHRTLFEKQRKLADRIYGIHTEITFAKEYLANPNKINYGNLRNLQYLDEAHDAIMPIKAARKILSKEAAIIAAALTAVGVTHGLANAEEKGKIHSKNYVAKENVKAIPSNENVSTEMVAESAE